MSLSYLLNNVVLFLNVVFLELFRHEKTLKEFSGMLWLRPHCFNHVSEKLPIFQLLHLLILPQSVITIQLLFIQVILDLLDLICQLLWITHQVIVLYALSTRITLTILGEVKSQLLFDIFQILPLIELIGIIL